MRGRRKQPHAVCRGVRACSLRRRTWYSHIPHVCGYDPAFREEGELASSSAAGERCVRGQRGGGVAGGDACVRDGTASGDLRFRRLNASGTNSLSRRPIKAGWSSLAVCECGWGHGGVGGGSWDGAGDGGRGLTVLSPPPAVRVPVVSPHRDQPPNWPSGMRSTWYLRSLIEISGTPGILRSRRFRSLSHVATM